MKCLNCIHLREITNGKRIIFCRHNLWVSATGRVTINSLKLLKDGSWLDKVIPRDCPFYEDEYVKGNGYKVINEINSIRDDIELEGLINEKIHR